MTNHGPTGERAIDTLKLVIEAFVSTPIFLVVPLVLLAFVFWSPWSPAKFYVHHDHQHLEEPLPSGDPSAETAKEPELRVY